MLARLRVVIVTEAKLFVYSLGPTEHSTRGAVPKQFFRRSYCVTSTITLIILKDILLDGVRFFVSFLCPCADSQHFP
jgi:hypothetical protein